MEYRVYPTYLNEVEAQILQPLKELPMGDDVGAAVGKVGNVVGVVVVVMGAVDGGLVGMSELVGELVGFDAKQLPNSTDVSFF